MPEKHLTRMQRAALSALGTGSGYLFRQDDGRWHSTLVHPDRTSFEQRTIASLIRRGFAEVTGKVNHYPAAVQLTGQGRAVYLGRVR